MLEFLDNHCEENDVAHPFQSIYSFQAVCDRVPERKYPGSKQITLVLAHLVDNYNNNTKQNKKNKKTTYLVDNYLTGNINSSHFAVKVLKDPRQSYIEVIHLRITMREWFFEVYLNSITSMPSDTRTQIKDLFKDINSVRDNVTAYEGVAGMPTKVIDTTYQAVWPASTQMIADLGEELCYTALFDGRYRDALKSHLGIEDIVEYPSIKCRLDEIQTKLKEEAAAVQAANAPVVHPQPGSQACSSGASQAETNAASETTLVVEDIIKDLGALHGPDFKLPSSHPVVLFEKMDDESKKYWNKYIEKQTRNYPLGFY